MAAVRGPRSSSLTASLYRSEPVKRAGLLELRLEMLRNQGQDMVESGNCILEAPELGKHATLFVPGICIFRGIYQKAFKRFCRFRIPFQSGKRCCPDVQGPGIFRVAIKGNVKRRTCILIFSGIIECSPALEIGNGIGWVKLKHLVK